MCEAPLPTEEHGGWRRLSLIPGFGWWREQLLRAPSLDGFANWGSLGSVRNSDVTHEVENSLKSASGFHTYVTHVSPCTLHPYARLKKF